jgi:hypothetical protein
LGVRADVPHKVESRRGVEIGYTLSSTIAKFVKAGFGQVYVHQVGADQEA